MIITALACAFALVVTAPAAGAFSTAWSPESSGTTSDLFGVDCTELPSSVTCYAVGGTGSDATILRGSNSTNVSGSISNWHAETAPVGTGPLHAVSCSDANTCTAVGNGGKIVRRTGGAWAPQASGRTTNLAGVSCWGVNGCVAVGDTPGPGIGPTILTWDGITWKAPLAVPLQLSPLLAVKCFATGVSANCFATGYGSSAGWVLASPDGGRNWVRRNAESPYDITGVACTSPVDCIAVDNGGGIVSRFAGNALWIGVQDPAVGRVYADNSLSAVGCTLVPGRVAYGNARRGHCAAVGYSGEAWGTRVVTRAVSATSIVAEWFKEDTGTAANLWGVSCTPGACRAVGDGGTILRS